MGIRGNIVRGIAADMGFGSSATGVSTAGFRVYAASSEILGQKGSVQTTASAAKSTATTQLTVSRWTGCRIHRRAAKATSIKSVASR